MKKVESCTVDINIKDFGLNFYVKKILSVVERPKYMCE